MTTSSIVLIYRFAACSLLVIVAYLPGLLSLLLMNQIENTENTEIAAYLVCT